MSGKVRKFEPPKVRRINQDAGRMLLGLGPALNVHDPADVLRFLSEKLGKMPSPEGCGITQITVTIQGVAFGAQFVVIAANGVDHTGAFAGYVEQLATESRNAGLAIVPGQPVERELPSPGGIVLPHPNTATFYPFNVTPLKQTPEH